jgi:hypothetical protein
MKRFVFLLALTAAGCGGGASVQGTGGHGGAVSSGSSSSGIGSGGASSTSSSSGFATGGGSSSSSASSATSASSSASSSSSSSGGDGGAPITGDCHTDADCPGGACVPVTPGGFLVCQTPPVKATVCGSTQDQCCAGKPCPGNVPCYAGPLVPFCAGIPMEPYNQCAVDQCTQDAECASGQICALAGTLGVKIRACVAAACKTAADCTTVPGGVCAPVQDPCCNTTAGLYCVYPGGCRSNADCGPGQYCQASGDQATCQTGAPICPL